MLAFLFSSGTSATVHIRECKSFRMSGSVHLEVLVSDLQAFLMIVQMFQGVFAIRPV